MNADAIAYYHDLLSGQLAVQAQSSLDAATEHFSLRFGSRPICTVLRPFLVTATQYESVMRDSLQVLSAIQKLSQALMSDAKLRQRMELTADEEEIIAIDPGYKNADASGRLDAFLDSRGGFSFVEYNAESPGGLLYGDVLSETFLQMEIVRQFARRYPVRRVPVRPHILSTLLGCYKAWGGSNHPQIAIVDWSDVSTRAEFEICREFFGTQGFRTIIVDPEELELRDGMLWAGDFRIDIVYKRVVTGELLERGGLNHPLIHAARDHAVCVVNSFRVQMLFKKTLFVLLDDPETEVLFSRDEVSALRRHIPWTRRLQAGFTNYHSQRVDLLDLVAASRERFVLKPSSEYGGRGVTLGWECTAEQWQCALKEALGSSFVVQERVEVLQEPFPSMVDGNIELARRYVDFDPYTWSGNLVDGAGIRLSSSALLNVTSGGGSATPLLILSEK